MLNLNNYKMTESLAFVLEEPAEYLPLYFDSWNYAAKNVISILSGGSARNALRQIPLLDVDCLLADHKAVRLAHLQLSTLISAYVWCEGDENVPRVLPESLAAPFWKVCNALGVTPGVAAHVSLALANYKLKTPNDKLCVENMEMLYFKFIEDYDNDWFFLLTTQLELDFAKGFSTLLDVMQASKTKNLFQLENGLYALSQTLAKMDRTLCRMPEHLNANKFFFGFRPFMAGTTGGRYEQWGGVTFENVLERPVKMTGGSAAQSSSLQCLDACLNITHDDAAQRYLYDVRNYILPEHRKFIEFVEAESSVRSTVSESLVDGLIDAYDECVKNLVSFRNHHIQIVSRFIVSPRAKEHRLAATSSAYGGQYKSLNEVGTGGTGIMPFLKSVRDSTASHILQQQKFVAD